MIDTKMPYLSLVGTTKCLYNDTNCARGTASIKLIEGEDSAMLGLAYKNLYESLLHIFKHDII